MLIKTVERERSFLLSAEGRRTGAGRRVRPGLLANPTARTRIAFIAKRLRIQLRSAVFG